MILEDAFSSRQFNLPLKCFYMVWNSVSTMYLRICRCVHHSYVKDETILTEGFFAFLCIYFFTDICAFADSFSYVFEWQTIRHYILLYIFSEISAHCRHRDYYVSLVNSGCVWFFQTWFFTTWMALWKYENMAFEDLSGVLWADVLVFVVVYLCPHARENFRDISIFPNCFLIVCAHFDGVFQCLRSQCLLVKYFSMSASVSVSVSVACFALQMCVCACYTCMCMLRTCTCAYVFPAGRAVAIPVRHAPVTNLRFYWRAEIWKLWRANLASVPGAENSQEMYVVVFI
jgi:hypothetical protein